MASAAPTNTSKKGKKVTCQTNGQPATTLYVSSNGNASAAPMVAVPMVAAKAKVASKTEVDAIIRDIDAAVNATVTKANLDQFNDLLTRYRAAVPDATEVKDISKELEGDALATAVGSVVAAVKASAPKAGGGRRKTHRKKHSMRSKRHCKTHKKHGGKRSTKHHKKHGKTRGKRSKHNKRSRKHRK
jgi:hypothetical protein